MILKERVDRALDIAASRALAGLSASPLIERGLLLQGCVAARQLQSVESVHSLADAEFSVFSQWGEDGIIEWLIHVNGNMPETFIEFGVEDYREANTRFLLMHRNWRGLVIDGSESNIARVRSDQVSWRHDLTAMAAFITTDNINQLIRQSGIVGEVGILSVDIDGNDYWVWRAIDCVRPHLVIAEYNTAFGDLHPITVPYQASFARGTAHSSNLYYGASIGALVRLAHEKGYALLGSNRAGSNAFFIRRDRLHRFEARIGIRAALPSRFREGRDAKGQLSFCRGTARSRDIAKMAVIDIDTGQLQSLEALQPLFSPSWLQAMEG